ncbi:DsbC family protein [Lampropedia puyangensis]|uniref:Thiol:disulfide interchange protein n=1 Tax=Lampropedia puyangensis TaxID=1330072 RepID=A0A4S8F922_9BURK|nr:DsbC family protein [Lampropedia puyangensis]THU04000.1 DsbC family protein [Lampropedia puyangensis]
MIHTITAIKKHVLYGLAASLALCLWTASPAQAQNAPKANVPQEAAIRTTLGERIPQMKSIEEVSATPMDGLYEVRIGTDVFYTNATGDFLIQGELYDTKAMRNLTEDRMKVLTAVDFSALPFEDAFTIVRGDGSRQLAIFEDPNCGYCKRFEKDMLNVDNVTVHVFLYPILSPDSFEKSRDIWCAKKPEETWNAWMLEGKTPPAQATCDKLEPLQRNLAFGRQYKITGTPTIVFEDNSRIPGAIPAQQVEQKLKEIAAAKKSS